MAEAGASTDYHAITHATPCDGDFFVCTWLPAAQQPSRRSSPRTCCYGSSLSARARYPHTAAAARPRTPSGSYAARHSAAAGTPSPRVSRRARRPVLSGASGNPGPETPTQYTTHNCRAIRHGRSSKTSLTRRPVCKHTLHTSRFDGMSAIRTRSTSLSNRYSVLIVPHFLPLFFPHTFVR